jgi:hypothetical protein
MEAVYLVKMARSFRSEFRVNFNIFDTDNNRLTSSQQLTLQHFGDVTHLAMTWQEAEHDVTIRRIFQDQLDSKVSDFITKISSGTT